MHVSVHSVHDDNNVLIIPLGGDSLSVLLSYIQRLGSLLHLLVPRVLSSMYCGVLLHVQPLLGNGVLKHVPAEANARNSRTSVTRQRSGKHTSA
jgi:hypothetical protein